MTAMRFVDSNVLIYGIDDTSPRKAVRAREILKGDIATSIQVLQEFYVQATRVKRPNRLSHDEAFRFIEDVALFPVQEMTLAVMRAALRTKQRFQINYWDAAIIEAARALGCDTVLSEDLSDGQDYGGVRVVNPF